MKYITLGITFLLFPFIAIAQEAFSGEFQLKANTDVEGLMLAQEYSIVIEDGNATVKSTRNDKPQEAKGTVVLSILSGIDPTTKRPAKFSGFLRIEVTTPGWVRDSFITRIEIPIQPTGETRKISGSPDPQPILGFAPTASIDMLTLDVLPGGLSRYSDPMDVRMHSEYTVNVIKNPIK